MTRGELCKLLEDEAKVYRKEWRVSLYRNIHMHNCRNFTYPQTLIDAILIDFINHIASGQGLDLGLYTKDLKDER